MNSERDLVVRVSDECVGVGQCVTIAPEVFDLDDDGYSRTRVGTVPADQREQVLRAVSSCPTGAIEVVS